MDIRKNFDPYANLVLCELCEDWWCVECELHWGECPCPGPHDEDQNDEDPDGG